MNKISHLERKWIFQESLTIPPELRDQFPLEEVILQTLVRRGITTPAHALRFLDHTKYEPTSPYELPDMEKGINRIHKAIQFNEKIGVWGDFDVDGQTSTAILVSVLRQIGAKHTYHIPIRGPETHGISLSALKKFMAEGVKVILTCDTGSSGNEAIAYAQSNGIDVVVTDHHQLPQVLPSAFALINPQRLPGGHALSTLPGAGTAYKFAEALCEKYQLMDWVGGLRDLAALGIIADLAELYADTRYLVQSGLSLLRASPRPALAAMFNTAEVDPLTISEEQVSFMIAPRLNAVGRLSDANPIVEFLLSQDASEIAVRVNQIEGLNSKRKLLCDQVFTGAVSLLAQNPALLEHALLLLHHPDWPAGVIGIVASRLVEIYHKPVILLTGAPGQPLHGSARSVAGVDITTALRRNETFLLSFGGHPMAAGLSLLEENLPALARGLDKTVSEAIVSSEIEDTLLIDQSIYPAQVSLELAQSLDMLAPFGPGNPSLVFGAAKMRIVETRPVGKLSEHMLIDVEDPGGNLNRFILWNGSGLDLPAGTFDLAYTPRATNYRGQDQVSLEWIDYRLVKDEIDVSTKIQIQPAQNIDLRNASLEEQVSHLSMMPDTILWKEGTSNIEINGVNRLELVPSKNLVLWSVPPDYENLKNILDAVKPTNIYWILSSPTEHQLKEFLHIFASHIKSAIKHNRNDIHIPQMAADLAVAEATIKLALNWLVAKGIIRTMPLSTGYVKVVEGGIPDPINQAQLEESLQQRFKELRAFTRYLKDVDLDKLTAELR